MEITTAAVSSLLPKLAERLQGRHKLRRETNFLIKELELTQASISDMPEDPLLHDAGRSLRDLSYDTEDILDSLIVNNVRRRTATRQFGSMKYFKKHNSLLRKLKTHLLLMQNRATELSGRSSRFKFKMDSDAIPRMGSGPLPDDPHVAAMSKEASGLVGMDRPRAELTELLLRKGELEAEGPDSQSRLKAVSIVGFGGLGKTTLARDVYNATKQYFECRAWVTVSQNPNLEQILIDILCQVEDPQSSSGSKGDGERDLISSTNKSLQGKRYLIVLDDLWSTGTLEVIKLALPLNNFGSRVIVTTRNLSVAQACCSYWNGHIYNILLLSSKDSWMLFNRRIFGEDPCPSELVDVVEKILRECSGVPLAIDIISSLLSCKPRSSAAWEDVLNSIASTSESLDGVTKVLLSSYYDLPHRLRVCLLYLSIFPEDYPIECDRIVRCWISEGFVLGNSVTTPEEVGQSYLTVLISRSLIQPVYRSYDGELEAIRIHDVVLDLIRSISTKENFVSILGKLRYPERVLDGNFRRLSIINTNEDNCITESVAKSPIRSLFIFGRVGLNISLKHFTLLRVLELEGCKDLRNQHIIEITKLLHLRFLSIRDTPITYLPDSFRSLATLEYTCIDIKEVKNKDMQLLSELCSLLYLSLSSRAIPTEKLVIGGNGFPVLREFHLRSGRADLTFEPQAMQNVDKLVVSSDLLPALCGIGNLRCLKKMEIRTAKVSRDVADVEIRKAAEENPNHPIVHIVPLGNLDDYATKEGKVEQNLEPIKDYEAKEGNELEENLGMVEQNLEPIKDYEAKEGNELEENLGKVEQNLEPIKDYEAKEGNELEENLEPIKKIMRPRKQKN